MERSPYQRILHAAMKGVGVFLSAEECRRMAADQAVITVAENDDNQCSCYLCELDNCRCVNVKKTKRKKK